MYLGRTFDLIFENNENLLNQQNNHNAGNNSHSENKHFIHNTLI